MGFKWTLLTPYIYGDKKFFQDGVEILKKRGLFEDTVWKYAFYHGDVNIARELFLWKL